jgi:hypothetical protein
MTEAEMQELQNKGWTEKYGVWWPPTMADPASIEQHMFLGKNGEHQSAGFLGKRAHFKNFMSLLFCHEKAVQPLQWNPNTELILDAYF